MSENNQEEKFGLVQEDINNILEFVYRLASIKRSYTRYVQGVLQLLNQYFNEKNMLFFYKHATIYPSLNGEGILYADNEETEGVVRYLEDFSLQIEKKNIVQAMRFKNRDHLLRFSYDVLNSIPERHLYKYVILDKEIEESNGQDMSLKRYLGKEYFDQYAVLPIYIQKVLVGAIYFFREPGEEPISERKLELISSVSRYIKAGLKEIMLYSESMAKEKIYINANAYSPIGNIILDQYRKVVFTNSMAEEYCEELGDEFIRRNGLPGDTDAALNPVEFVVEELRAYLANANEGYSMDIETEGASFHITIKSFVNTNLLNILQAYYMIYIVKEKEKKPVSLEKLASMCSLTSRETEIVRLLEQGNTNQEIAEKLCISMNTVKAHISSIYRKLGVQSRTALVYKLKEYNENV